MEPDGVVGVILLELFCVVLPVSGPGDTGVGGTSDCVGAGGVAGEGVADGEVDGVCGGAGGESSDGRVAGPVGAGSAVTVAGLSATGIAGSIGRRSGQYYWAWSLCGRGRPPVAAGAGSAVAGDGGVTVDGVGCSAQLVDRVDRCGYGRRDRRCVGHCGDTVVCVRRRRRKRDDDRSDDAAEGRSDV